MENGLIDFFMVVGNSDSEHEMFSTIRTTFDKKKTYFKVFQPSFKSFKFLIF